MKLYLAYLLSFANGQFYGKYQDWVLIKFGIWQFRKTISRKTRIIVRLANWNTGRIYIGDEYSFGISGWGPVCLGTRDQALLWNTESGDIFAELVCKKANMGAVKFMGTKDEYFHYMKNTNYDLEKLNTDCIPDYKIAGGNCPANATSLEDCKLRNFGVHGGTCLQGSSDLFIDCEKPVNVLSSDQGLATLQSGGEHKYCDKSSDYFRQAWDDCVPIDKDSKGVPQCSTKTGWLKPVL